MRRPIGNALYGVLDYAAFSIRTLLVAPILLRRMGFAEYGVWTVAASAVSTGIILASGFGDADIKHLARTRGRNQEDTPMAVVRTMMGIHLLRGALLAMIAWTLSPMAAARIAPGSVTFQFECLWSLRIACSLILIRALESVCIITQRCFERYGTAVRASILNRVAGLLAAVPLSLGKHPVIAIVVANPLLSLTSLCLQPRSLKKLCIGRSTLPTPNVSSITKIVGFGSFSWILALSGVIFSHVDRLMLGVVFIPVVLASYVLSTQLTQPIYGLTASGLHFLFPYLSSRVVGDFRTSHRQVIWLALGCNFVFVFISAFVVMALGAPVLTRWASAAITQTVAPIFPMIVWGSTLMGLSLTGTYTLMAMGQMRTVTFLNLAGGCLMLLKMWKLSGAFSVGVFTYTRFGCGSISLVVYIPLIFPLFPQRSKGSGMASLRLLGEER